MTYLLSSDDELTRFLAGVKYGPDLERERCAQPSAHEVARWQRDGRRLTDLGIAGPSSPPPPQHGRTADRYAAAAEFTKEMSEAGARILARLEGRTND